MSDLEAIRLVDKHGGQGVFVDTNLLLLSLIGQLSPELVTRFKRTRMFEVKDFVLLQSFLKKFVKIIATPGILTEVNGLANQLEGRLKPAFLQLFRSQIALFDERPVTSKVASEHPCFERFGLTDAAIRILSAEQMLVLTDDFALSGYLTSEGIDCINFNHIRYVSPS